jgi:hypothetical protein
MSVLGWILLVLFTVMIGISALSWFRIRTDGQFEIVFSTLMAVGIVIVLYLDLR